MNRSPVKYVVCGTGHRPNKLGGYSIDAAFRTEMKIVDWLDEKGGDFRDNLVIISGGALGWDQALARAAARCGVPYLMYLPFEGFDSRWPPSSRKELEGLCSAALDVVYVEEPGYAPWKMQRRNEAMVDTSDLVLACWNGTQGGTANCVRYAEKIGRPIVNLWSDDLGKEKDS